MTHGFMTLQEFNEALDRGPYAWPGGYPVYFITADGESLSFAAAQSEANLIRDAIQGDDNTGGWRVIGVDINWEDPELYCAHTGLRIESAYAEDDAEVSQ